MLRIFRRNKLTIILVGLGIIILITLASLGSYNLGYDTHKKDVDRDLSEKENTAFSFPKKVEGKNNLSDNIITYSIIDNNRKSADIPLYKLKITLPTDYKIIEDIWTYLKFATDPNSNIYERCADHKIFDEKKYPNTLIITIEQHCGFYEGGMGDLWPINSVIVKELSSSKQKGNFSDVVEYLIRYPVNNNLKIYEFAEGSKSTFDGKRMNLTNSIIFLEQVYKVRLDVSKFNGIEKEQALKIADEIISSFFQ